MVAVCKAKFQEVRNSRMNPKWYSVKGLSKETQLSGMLMGPMAGISRIILQSGGEQRAETLTLTTTSFMCQRVIAGERARQVLRRS
jgi:hypothetical protein